MPHGPRMLSASFEWVTLEGSRDGCLKETVEGNSKSVFSMIQTFLSDKKGEAWDLKFEEVANTSQANYGNDIMIKVFLIRDLARTWKNQAEKIIFVEGEDDITKVSNQPFIHILKVAQVGETDYDEKIHISVRIGNTLVFDDVTLIVALASMIQLAFVFHLMYPSGADDIFQFAQRILANFGPTDGARNAQGKVKKHFIDFQISIGKMMVENRKGEVVKMFL